MIFGAHISLRNGLVGSLDLAQEVGAKSIQLFASNPRQWKTSQYPSGEAKEFKKRLKKEGLGPVFLHAIYLINLASDSKEIREKSIKSLRASLVKADQIGARGVVTHLGSTKKRDEEEALDEVVRSIKEILKGTPSNLILENSAGAGNIIGDRLEELAKIIKKVDSKEVKVCLDTCHLFASSYELRDKEGVNKLFSEFENMIGLDRLALLHLNDSASKKGSNVDRHANIGQGKIGKKGFKCIVTHPKLKSLPAVIETPSIEKDDKNLKLLKSLSNE